MSKSLVIELYEICNEINNMIEDGIAFENMNLLNVKDSEFCEYVSIFKLDFQIFDGVYQINFLDYPVWHSEGDPYYDDPDDCTENAYSIRSHVLNEISKIFEAMTISDFLRQKVAQCLNSKN